MHTERWTRAITELRRVHAERLPFYAGEWFDAGRPYDCDTAACAAGWLCRNKWMQDEGLEIDRTEFPAFEGSRGFEALALFFEVEIVDDPYAPYQDDIIHQVFSGGLYGLAYRDVTAGMVADRMQQISGTGDGRCTLIYLPTGLAFCVGSRPSSNRSTSARGWLTRTGPPTVALQPVLLVGCAGIL